MNQILTRSFILSVTLLGSTSNALAYDPYERESIIQSPKTEDESVDYTLEKPSDRQLNLVTKPTEEVIPAIDSENVATEVTYSGDSVFVLRNAGAME